MFSAYRDKATQTLIVAVQEIHDPKLTGKVSEADPSLNKTIAGCLRTKDLCPLILRGYMDLVHIVHDRRPFAEAVLFITARQRSAALVGVPPKSIVRKYGLPFYAPQDTNPNVANEKKEGLKREAYNLLTIGKFAQVAPKLAKALVSLVPQYKNPVVYSMLFLHGHFHFIRALDAKRPLAYHSGWLLHACTSGNLKMVRWLVDRFNLTAECAEKERALTYSCVCRHLRIAQWLTDNFGLTIADARVDDNVALRGNCWSNHPTVFEWLAKQYKLPALDTISKGSFVLHKDGKSSKLEMVKWLIETFELTAKDVRGKENYALRKSCMHGEVKMAKWLVERFELTVADVRVKNNYALRESCKHGRLETIQWLIECFGLSKEDVRTHNDYALRESFTQGHFEVTKWLAQKFYTESEAQEICPRLFTVDQTSVKC